MKQVLLNFKLADKLKIFMSFALIFFSISAFSQNTYYIDPGAASNGDGTMNSPYDGWDKVFPMEVGATYLQKTGTTWNDSLAIEAEGVTIGSYGSSDDTARIIAEGKDAISNVADTAKNVTIKDLYILTDNNGGKGIVWINSESLTIENVEVDSTDGWGVHIDGVDNFIIRSSHIHHNDRPVMIYNSDDWLVEYCKIHDGINRGGFQTSGTNGGMFRYNRVFNDPNNKFLLFLEGNDSFMYNVIYNSGKAGVYMPKGGANTFIGNTFNNTNFGIRMKTDGHILKNNIFSNMDLRALWLNGGSPAESDYNMFYNVQAPFYDGGNVSLEEWQAIDGQTLDMNSIEADPNYVDADNFNFELTDSSGAIDKGMTLDAAHKMALAEGTMWPGDVELLDQFENGSWDIGAYAFAPQTVFYIDPMAATDGNGKEATPYNSWQNVTMMEGMTYLQKRGTVSNDTIGVGVDNVTIGSYGDEDKVAKIIVNGNDAISNVADTAKNVTIKDLWITTEGSGKGIYWQNTTGLTVENVEIDSTDGFGIHIDGVHNFVVKHSHIHHNDRPFMVYNSNDWLVEYCEIHDGIDRGAFQTNNTNNGMFRYNKVYNDLNKKYLLFTEGNDTFAYNLIYNATKAAAQVTNGNSTFIGNTFDNTSWGLRIKGGTNTVVKNNIFSNLDNRAIYENGALPSESDYNMFYNVKGAYFTGSTTYSIEDWQAQDNQGLDDNSFNGDPNYVDLENDNYALTDSSAAIDAGTELADDYKLGLDAESMWTGMVKTRDQSDNGTGWEIGAYVFPEPITHIDPSVASSGDGSMESPIKNWSEITWEPGRTYLQKRGTVSNDTLGINVDNVTIGSYGPEGDTAKIIVDGKNAISNVDDTAKNVTIKDLYISTTTSGIGIDWKDAENLMIENVTVAHTAGFGIMIDGVDNLVAKGNHVHHNDRPFLVYNSDDWLVEDNSIHDGVNRGGFQTNNTNNGMFRYNYVYNDPNKNYLLFVEGNDTYMYNVLYNSEKAGAFVIPGSSSTFIGNTFDDTKYAFRNRSENTIIKNNIFANMSERALRWDGAQAAESDYNLFYNYNKGAYLDANSKTWSLEEWQAVEGQTLDMNSIEGNAYFVDEDNNNYELTDSSAAIDVGMEMADMYKMALDTGTMWPGMVNLADQNENGNGWEIGAYVFPTLNTVATLDITSDNGTVMPAERSYIIGTVVELTAKGDLGYAFESWSGDVSSTDNPLTVKLDSNINLTASYTSVDVYDLSVTAQNGSANITDSSFNTGTEVELTVEADSGYAFINWTDASGDTVSSEATFTLTMDKAYELTANITKQYRLTAVFPKGGSVEPMEGIYLEGEEVEVKAMPSTGFTFMGWSGDASGMDPDITVTMDSDKEVIADFKEAYYLTINTGDGTVDQESGAYLKDTSLTVTATPDEGYQFLRWTGDMNATDNPLDITLTRNMTVNAVFVRVFNVDFTAENGSVNYPDTVIKNGERIAITATPDEGYIFSGWSGDVTGSNESTYITVESDMNITANFTKLYTLTVSAENGSVNVTETTVPEGTGVELEATPDEGYEFISWSGVPDADTASNPVTVTVNSDMTVTANIDMIINISSVEFDGHVNIYPNPAANFLTVDISGNAQNYVVEMVNITGQQVINQIIGSSDAVNVSNLKSGIYIVRILEDNQVIHKSRIIKE